MSKVVYVRRMQSVDVFRSIAIFAVIVIHTAPFELSSSPIGLTLDLATMINQMARFAVPFFFTISGYFWANKVAEYGSVLEPTLFTIKRIMILFCAWSLIYLIPWNLFESLEIGLMGLIKMTYWNMVMASRDIPKIIIQGTESHLWFLMALVFSIGISALFIHFHCVGLLTFIALLLYVIGLAGKAYSETPFGLHFEFNFRYGPFFSLIFFVTGIFLQRIKLKINWFEKGVKLLALGAIIHFIELYMLNRIWGVSMLQDYVFGTYLFGVGAALIALSDFSLPILSRAASVGPLVLGIYASHFIFIDLFKPINRLCEGNIAWAFSCPIIVFTFSYILSWGLSKNKITKFLVC